MTSSTTDPATLLASGREVVAAEAAALMALAEGLEEGFARAVVLMMQAPGRVILSGMGKSGHVARKIAATFASTGTPAHFVHPAEASHGDLGMVAAGDVLVMLSNSGETAELADLLAHARRYSIPVVAVTARPDSTLGRQADVLLALPAVPEACGTGIVPTTSTTMAMALGDALAVALMRHRRFTPDHFRLFHPGGRLGARLLRVRDLMHAEMPLVVETAAMDEALITISRMGFGVAGVTDGSGCLTGIITDGDLRRHMTGLLGLTAGQVMTRAPRTISPDALAEQALAVMNDRKITCLFVLDAAQGGQAQGILHIHDLLRAGLA